jgi:hypothetical protein
LRATEKLSGQIQFFFLVDLVFTADEIHFPVWDGPIAVPPLPERDKETEHRETDISAREGSGVSQVSFGALINERRT